MAGEREEQLSWENSYKRHRARWGAKGRTRFGAEKDNKKTGRSKKLSGS